MGTVDFDSSTAKVAEVVAEVAPGQTSIVTLVASRGGTVRGRVTGEGATLRNLEGLSVIGHRLEPDALGGEVRQSRVDADGSFELAGLHGAVQFSVGGAGAAVIKAIRYRDMDISTNGIDPLGRSLSGIEIHLTTEVGELSGVVTTADGRPCGACSVVIFSEDQERWFGPLGRGYWVGRSDEEGHYSASGFLAGTYLVAVVPDFDEAMFGDPAIMPGLQDKATSVQVSSGERRKVDMKLRER
jgi:hypothetical protein